MIVIKEIVAKVARIKAFVGFCIVSVFLVYFALKYYSESRLVFEQNSFVLFLIFALLVLWGFAYLIYETIQNKRKTEKLQENDVVMKDMLQIIIDNQCLSDAKLEKYNRNTRKYIVDMITMLKEDCIDQYQK